MSRDIDIAEQQFVAYITDKDNPKTYNNATQSYKAIRPHVTTGTARAYGCQVLARPRVQQTIDDILEAAGCNLQVRVQQLSHISAGVNRRKTIIYRKVKRTTDGNSQDAGELEVDQVIETEPTYAERVKALDILNRMSGTYERASVARQIAQDEYSALRARLYPKLRKVAGEEDKGCDTTIVDIDQKQAIDSKQIEEREEHDAQVVE